MATLSISKTYDANQILTESDLDNIRSAMLTYCNTTKADDDVIDLTSVVESLSSSQANTLASKVSSTGFTAILSASTSAGKSGALSNITFRVASEESGSAIDLKDQDSTSVTLSLSELGYYLVRFTLEGTWTMFYSSSSSSWPGPSPDTIDSRVTLSLTDSGTSFTVPGANYYYVNESDFTFRDNGAATTPANARYSWSYTLNKAMDVIVPVDYRSTIYNPKMTCSIVCTTDSHPGTGTIREFTYSVTKLNIKAIRMI